MKINNQRSPRLVKLIRSRGGFYFFFVAFFLIELLVSFLSLDLKKYSAATFLGFFISLVVPVLLVVACLGFAFLIKKNLLYYVISICFALLGTILIYGNVLFYRLHGFFFLVRPVQLAIERTTDGSLLRPWDFIYWIDFVIFFVAFFLLRNQGKIDGFLAQEAEKSALQDFDALLEKIRSGLVVSQQALALQEERLENLQTQVSESRRENLSEIDQQLTGFRAEVSSLREAVETWSQRKEQLETQNLALQVSLDQMKQKARNLAAQRAERQVIAQLSSERAQRAQLLATRTYEEIIARAHRDAEKILDEA